jgi:uncharacterized protein YjbI with pentapeptide repeats
LVVIAALTVAIIWAPIWFVPEPEGVQSLPSVERVNAENQLAQTRNQVRTTMVQAVGGALLILTFAVGVFQIRTTRQGQLTDRFTKTIDQLNQDRSVEVRLGAIYALEQMASDSAYRLAVAEILEAYLGTHSVEPSESELSVRGGRLRPDLQAALRILIIDGLWRQAAGRGLDLAGVILPVADLADANIANVTLVQAHLEESRLTRVLMTSSDLSGADLSGADLADARFENCDFSRSVLVRATMSRASFVRCLFKGVQFLDAKCQEADFSDADAGASDFRGANLTAANFEGAFLNEARFNGAVLRGARFADAQLNDADLTGAHLEGALFTGATMRDVSLTGAIVDASTSFEDVKADNATRAVIATFVNP